MVELCCDNGCYSYAQFRTTKLEAVDGRHGLKIRRRQKCKNCQGAVRPRYTILARQLNYVLGGNKKSEGSFPLFLVAE